LNLRRLLLLPLLMTGALLVVGQLYVTLAPPMAQVLAPLGWPVLLLTPAVALSCAATIVGAVPELSCHLR
jgi:ABC-type uncharacterized transport system permease subunit